MTLFRQIFAYRLKKNVRQFTVGRKLDDGILMPVQADILLGWMDAFSRLFVPYGCDIGIKYVLKFKLCSIVSLYARFPSNLHN